MKHLYLKLALVVAILSSCSSFNKLAKQNKFGIDDSFTVYSNESVNLKSPTFGDFKFASNGKEYKKINNKKPAFKNILLYAKTLYPEYEYYILLNTTFTEKPGFIMRNITVDNKKITLAISNNAPEEDVEVIASKMAKL